MDIEYIALLYISLSNKSGTIREIIKNLKLTVNDKYINFFLRSQLFIYNINFLIPESILILNSTKINKIKICSDFDSFCFFIHSYEFNINFETIEVILNSKILKNSNIILKYYFRTIYSRFFTKLTKNNPNNITLTIITSEGSDVNFDESLKRKSKYYETDYKIDNLTHIIKLKNLFLK